MASLPGSFGAPTVDPLAYTEDQGGLQPAPQPVFVPSPEPVQQTPVTPSLVDRGIAFVKDVFTPAPEPVPGDPDYSAPMRELPPPVTDWNSHLFDQEEIDVLAGSPGLLHTIGEEVGTRRGLMQKIPVFGSFQDSAKIVRAYVAAQKLKNNSFDSPEDEQKALSDVVSYFNETRVREKMDQNRSALGTMVSYPLRSIPFALEIMLSQLLTRRLGIKPGVLPSLTKVAVGEEARQVEMGAFRVGATRFFNKFIGENGEKLITDRMKALSETAGYDLAKKELEKGSSTLMQSWIKEARQGLAKNILNRTAPETAENAGQYLMRQLPGAEVDVARKLIDNSTALRILSRSVEVGMQLPFMAPGKLATAGLSRQLAKTPMSRDENGKITFGDTGETMMESQLKGLTNEYFEYLSEYSGGVIQDVLKKGIGRHLVSVKLAELATKLPGKLPIGDKIKSVMGSKFVARGFTVGGRIMNQAARRMAIYDPLSEYGEEVVNMVGQSVFNLNDDGTPWATRVAKSFLHPILNPKEAALMIGGFSLMPAAAFTAGAAMGKLTDAEVQQGRTLLQAIVNPPPADGIGFADAEQTQKAAAVFLDWMKEQQAQGEDSSLLGNLFSRVFNQPAPFRPGSGIWQLSQTAIAGGGDSATVRKNLRDRILNAPAADAVDLISRVLTLHSNVVMINGLNGFSEEDKKALATVAGIGQQMSEAVARVKQFMPEAIISNQQAVAPQAVEASLEEQKADPLGLRYKSVLSSISLPRLTATLADLQKQLPELAKKSTAGYEQVKPLVTELQNAVARFSGATTDKKFLDVVKPYVQILTHDIDEQEAKGQGIFSVAQEVTAKDLAETGDKRQGYLKLWDKQGKLGGLLDTLKRAVSGGERDYYYVPGVGLDMMDADSWRKLGYDSPQGFQRTSYGFIVPKRNGRRERVYLTNLSTPLDVAHEASHPHTTAIAQTVAQTLLKFHKESTAVGAVEGLKAGWEQLARHMDRYLPTSTDPETQKKTRMTLTDFLTGVQSNEDFARNIDPRFAEDLANLTGLYMGHEHGLDRSEMKGARLLYAHLKENPWFIHGMEQVIQGKTDVVKGKKVVVSKGDATLKRLHHMAPTPEAAESVRQRVQDFTTDEKAKREAAKAADKTKDKKEKEVAKPVEVKQVKVDKTPDKKAVVVPPVPAKKQTIEEQLAEMNAPLKAKQAAEDTQAASDAIRHQRPDLGTPLKQSMGEVTPLEVDQQKDVVRMARLLSILGKQLYRPTDKGAVSLPFLTKQLKQLNIASRVMTAELHEAYFTSQSEHYEVLQKILTQPAGKWMPELLADQERLSKTPGRKETLKKAFDEQQEKEITNMANLGFSREDAVKEVQKTAATEDTSEEPEAEEGPAEALGDFEQFDPDHGVKNLLKREDVRRLHDELDLTYGAERMNAQKGVATLTRLLNHMHNDRAVLHELIVKSLVSKDAFNHAMEDPAVFLQELKGTEKFRVDIMDFWNNHLAPVLRAYTYEELMSPTQETRLGDTLDSLDLRIFLEVVADKNGERSYVPMNVSRSDVSAVRKMVKGWVEGLFQRSGKNNAKSHNIWEAEGTRIRAASARFAGKEWHFGKIKDVFGQKTVSVNDLRDGLEMLWAILPEGQTAVTFADLTALLEEPAYHHQIQLALKNFIWTLDANGRNTPKSPGRTAKEALSAMRQALVGNKKNWGVIPNILRPATAKGAREVYVRSNNQRKTALRDSGLIRLLNPQLKEFRGLGLVAPNAANWNLRYLNYGFRDEGTGFPSDAKQFSGDERVVLAADLLAQGAADTSEHPHFLFVLAPLGNKTIMPTIEVRYFKPGKELSDKYHQVYEWLRAHGGVEGVTSLKVFDSKYANREDGKGNWVLYAAMAQRVVAGTYGPYGDIFGLIKRGSQTMGGTSTLPSETGFPVNIGILRMQSVDTVRGDLGMLPVTEKLRATWETLTRKPKTVPVMDGQFILTEAGAKGFRADKSGSTKGLLTGVKNFFRFLYKGNSIYLTLDTMAKLHPAYVAMQKWVNAYNAKNPQAPIHLISVADNAKVLPGSAIPASRILYWDDAGKLQFDAESAKTAQPDSVPLSGYSTVADLKASTAPKLQTASTQLQASVNIAHMRVIQDDILFPMMNQNLAELTSLDGDFDTFKAALIKGKYLREDNENDKRLLALVNAGVDIRRITVFQNLITNMVYSRVLRTQAKLFGIKNQTLDNTLDPEEVKTRVPEYLDRKGNVLVGDAVIAAQKTGDAYIAPADLYANIKGARADEIKTFQSPSDDKNAAVLVYLWARRQIYPDLFRSTMVKAGDTRYLQLEKELMPDVLRDMNVSDPVLVDGTYEYTFTLVGEPVVSSRTPNSGSESSTLFRLRGKVGKGGRANWSVSNGRIAFYAGEDYDGDWRLTYLSPKSADKRPVGHTPDIVDGEDRIWISLPAGTAKWTDEAASSLGLMVMARGMAYASESPRYFNPAIGIDPINRILEAQQFDSSAKAGKDRILQEAKENGWNGVASYELALRMPGDLQALGVSVRLRAFLQFMLEHRVTPAKRVGFTIAGRGFQFDAGEKFSPEREGALLQASGTIMGLVADQMKDFNAHSLHMTKDLLGLMYSVLISNPRIVRVGKLKDDEGTDKLLKSVVGTLEFLQDTLFSPAMLNGLKDAGFSEDVVLKKGKPAQTLWRNESLEGIEEEYRLRDLLRLAYSVREVSKSFDLYRSITPQKAAKFPGDMVFEDPNAWKMVFDTDALLATPPMAQSKKTVDRARELLPESPVEKFPHGPLADAIIANQGAEFEKNYPQILESVYDREDLWSELLVPLDTETGVPSLAQDAKESVPSSAISSAYLALPEDAQTALAINALKQWGLDGKQQEGSYLNLLPVETHLWLQTEMDKVKEVKSAPVGKEAAALTGQTGILAAPVKQTPGAVSSVETQALVNKLFPLGNLQKEIGDTGKPVAIDPEVKHISLSMGEAELAYRIGDRLSPTNALHQEMREKFHFVDRLVDIVRMDIQKLRRMAGGKGYEKADELWAALSFYQDAPGTHEEKRKTKLRVAEAVRLRMTIQQGGQKFEYFDEAKTVGEVIDEYEKARRDHGNWAPFKELSKEGTRIYEYLRTEMNKHTELFSSSRELFQDIRLREKPGVEYIHHETFTPFGLDIGDQIRVALRKWYTTPHAKGETFELTINPMDASKLVVRTLVPAKVESVKSQFPSLSETEIETLIKQAEEKWKKAAQGRPRPAITESVSQTQQRRTNLEEEFKEYGQILKNPNFLESLDNYTRQSADYATSLRYLSYMANLTDAYGTPAAFFMATDDKTKREQKLISKTALRAMFTNWRTRLLLDGNKAPDYDVTKDIWDNLKILEASASDTWFIAHGYQRVELGRKTEGFDHAWVLKGSTKKLLDHVTSRGFEDLADTSWEGVLKKTLKVLLWFNQMTKQLALSISLFHAATLMESHVSSYGITGRNPLLNPWKFIKEIGEVWKTTKNVMSDPVKREALSNWMDVSLTIRFSDRDPLEMADLKAEGGPMDRGLTGLVKLTEKSPLLHNTLGLGPRVARGLKQRGDHLLWEVLQPASKFMMAERTYDDILSNPDYDHLTNTAEGRLKVKREIAQVTNQAFGGLEWREMIWATPLMRDVMRAVVFAPDWTFANLQMAMVPDIFQKVSGIEMPFGPTAETDIRAKFLIEKNWPAFIYLTLMMVPMMWQVSIYLAMGDPDKGDKPFMFENEEGKELSVDLSPLYRKLGIKFGITEKRRTYLQWGKSGYEIGAWFTNPFGAFLKKTSMGVKVAWEQFTGRNTAGWDMPWAKDDASAPFGGIFMVDGKPLEGRLGYIAQKFAPMTLLNMFSETKPSSLFAPTALGMGSYKAERFIADILQAYGDETLWYQLKGKPERVKKLATLVDDTLEAAWLNGYDVKKVMSTAKGLAHGRQSAEFFAELEKDPKKPNLAKLEKIARAAQRTETMGNNFYRNIGNKYAKRSRTMTPVQQGAMQAAWQAAREKRGEEQ